MKERLKVLQNERRALDVDVGESAESELTILSHPNLPELYRRKVQQLEAILEGPGGDHGPHPLDDRSGRASPSLGRQGLEAILPGDLAACAGASAENENAPDLSISGRRLSMVAGTGFEPVTFRL